MLLDNPFALANAGLIWLAIIAYAVLGGADFGAGVWDALAFGTRADREREAIASAIGPVWEANNVWLIFVLVATWTAFPTVYSSVSTAFFIPASLAVIGIVLRGAAFAYRAHFAEAVPTRAIWGRVFSSASIITPFLLGCIAGALASGNLRILNGAPIGVDYLRLWTTPFALVCGAFAISLCSVLAATYLTVEAQMADDQALVQYFRGRAVLSGAVTAGLGIIAALLARADAPLLWSGLTGRALPLSIGAVLLGIAAAATLLTARYRLARILVAAGTLGVLAAWAVGQSPYLIVPDVTIANAASPPITQQLLFWSSLAGMVLFLPSLWFLFHVFKGKNVSPGPAREDPAGGTSTQASATALQAPGAQHAPAAPPPAVSTADPAPTQTVQRAELLPLPAQLAVVVVLSVVTRWWERRRERVLRRRALRRQRRRGALPV